MSTTPSSADERDQLIERLKLEAQIHAQEARTAKATIAEIYRVVTGGTGEPGNWNGAEPVRKCIEDLRASLGAAQVPSLSEQDRHQGEVAVLEAAIASTAGHLGALIDELRGMMAKALQTMTALHNVATPDEDTPDLDARIPADDFRKFVDAHAKLLYAFAPHKQAAAALSQPSQQGQGS